MSSLLVICLGWCSNIVGSESGEKQSVKLLQNITDVRGHIDQGHIVTSP
jgi:hypothetical protein